MTMYEVLSLEGHSCTLDLVIPQDISIYLLCPPSFQIAQFVICLAHSSCSTIVFDPQLQLLVGKPD